MTMQAICSWYAITPQAHYQMKRRQQTKQKQDAKVLKLVQTVRAKHKRMGTRKLLHELRSAGVSLGRDKLFDLLRQQGLLVARRRRQTRTTFAGGWHSENLLQGLKVTRPNQVWVTDITYIDTEQGFNYLALVTDLFSRRIVGFDLSKTLAHEGARRAFDRAVRLAGKANVKHLIHHSDHGTQYTSRPYRQRLTHCGVRSSMGEVGNCYDNAVAERVNGILKLEYGLDERFANAKQAARAVREGVWLYNHERPHLSLQMHKPDDVYYQRVSFSPN